MKAIPSIFKIQLVVFLAISALVILWLAFRTGDDRIQLAEESYQKGEASTSIAERKEAFNKALNLFLKLDGDYQPNFGTGKLSFDIANTYFQLGEYPLSILYYKRAENLMPRAPVVKRNLAQAQSKIGLTPSENNHLLNTVMLKSYISLPERLQIFFVLGLVTLFFSSLWLWKKKQWLSNVGVIFLLCFAGLLVNLGLSYYFAPVEAVFIKAAELRRDAGEEFAKVQDQPISGGTLVEVVSTSPNGKWLKVFVPGGNFGFVPSESVRLVDL